MQKIIWFGLDGLLLVRKGFSKAARVAFSAAVLRIRIRDRGSGAFLTPGPGIQNRFFPDPGSRIPDPNPYFWEFSDNFLGKKFYNSLKIGPNFFLQHSKNKIVQFVKFMAH